MSHSKVYVVAAVRTPMGSFGGSLKEVAAPKLGAAAIKGAIEKAGIAPEAVDEVIMGAVIQANMGQAPARQAAKFAGLPDKVICSTINKVCASGMKAIAMGAQSIILGDADVVVVGGMESMSNVPYYIEQMRWGGVKYGNTPMIDGLAKDGLTDVYHGYAMGCAADQTAAHYAISRERQDEYAINSYKKSQAAWSEGKFDAEIVPVAIPQKKGDPIIFAKDEEPWNVKFDKIAGLKPAFSKEGTVTAANASTMNDGAAALVLVSEAKLKALGLTPIATIAGWADAERAPEWFTTAPSLAMPKALQKVGLTVADIDLFEINEAFSVVALANMQELGLDPEKVNVNGGAVAMGHALGCSGARIVVTLIHALHQTGGKKGLAGICNGGGGASAMVVEIP